MNSLRLKAGDVIGLASPSSIATPEGMGKVRTALEEMGFSVKLAERLFDCSWRYAASDTARAEGLNGLIRDPDVKLIFFGGGEGADEVLPLIDYEAARRQPKMYLSYSDGTSILNALWDRAGAQVYYGQTPGLFPGISDYNLAQFRGHLMEGADRHTANSDWRTLCQGRAKGMLIGGYLDNFNHLIASGWVRARPGRQYVLFIEDHEKFVSMDRESDLLGRLEQNPFTRQVSGLLFGHYSAPVNGLLLERLRRLGERLDIPVAYCDDFGHGENRAILPIGREAVLDTSEKTLVYR